MNQIHLKPFLWLIRLYRLIASPWVGQGCRFTPTCSAYSEQALKTHGLFKGSWLTLKRLLRCNPWGASGFDPVPPKKYCKCEAQNEQSKKT